MNDKKKQLNLEQRKKLMKKMRARSQLHDQLLGTSVELKDTERESKSKEIKISKKKGDNKISAKLAREEDERLLIEEEVFEKCIVK
jgi:hypothetical protein